MLKFHLKKAGVKKPGGRKKKKLKVIIITAAVILVAGGGLTAYAIVRKNSSDSTTTLTKYTVSSTTLTTTVSGSGTVSNANSYSLTAPANGTVKKVYASQGDTVTKGEVIAVLTSTDVTDSLIEKKSALATAESDLEDAEAKLDDLYIKSPIAGRVKSLSISSGDDISTAKLLSDDLCVISTAGTMYVSISSPSVTLSDDTKVYVYNKSTGKKISSGTVSIGTTGSSASGSNGNSGSSGITVTIPTDTPDVDTAVTVKTTGGTVVGYGTLQLTKSYAITTQSSGTMSKVYVTENEKVSKNTKLFKLDDSSVQKAIEQAKKSVESAQEAVDNAQDAVDALTITSPINGTIATMKVKKGSTLNNGGSICTIIDPDEMQTVISVDEQDINSVSVGQSASITLEALNKEFTGLVTSIDAIGSSQSGSASYDVTVSIDDPENVKVGMTTNAEITTSTQDNVITVPAKAVLNISGTTGYVLSADVMANDNVTSETISNADIDELVKKYGVKVTIGTSTSDEYQITSGLSVGDEYVVAVTVSKSKVASLSNSSASTATMAGGMGGGGNMGGGTMPTGGGGGGNVGGGQ